MQVKVTSNRPVDSSGSRDPLVRRDRRSDFRLLADCADISAVAAVVVVGYPPEAVVRFDSNVSHGICR